MATCVEEAEKTCATPWYKEAVIYEVHVRAFYDSNGDGTGDFKGMLEKLDYIQALGVTALWLLPFCPSPWLDDGYDVSHYTEVHPAYGCLDDFRALLEECHRRNLKVITELILNHTSDTHPWFQRARQSPPGSDWRDFYVWSDTPDKYNGVRVIFKDFEKSNWTWDPVANAYYWHRFFSHQPDLNYDSPHVRQAIRETVDFWFELGVDGLRLDAVPYLFEREGTTCENLPETHAFLRDLRTYIDARYQGRMLLAEANQWPEDAAVYFGQGDECHLAFHFPLMPRLFMAMRMEDAFPVENIVGETPQIPPNCQWATFLRNHDELTLEMVCDEEREFMYQMYARDPEMRLNVGICRRLAPLLDNDRRRIELMNALLFSLPGTPVIYYGDEIGMGDDLTLGDRNGVRTPMQWTADTNAGFSQADPASLYLPVIANGNNHYSSVNVESEQANQSSLLWWMRRALSIRRHSKALTTGETRFLRSDNRHVLAFLRQSEDETVLVLANLSRLAQPVRIPLKRFAGLTPIEMFGRVDFPQIDRNPYTFTLAPHGFYWFVLGSQQSASEQTDDEGEAVPVPVKTLVNLFDWESRSFLADLITTFLRTRTVVGSRKITYTEVVDALPFGKMASLAVTRVHYEAGESELQLLPLSLAFEEQDALGRAEQNRQILAFVNTEAGDRGILYLSRNAGAIGNALLELIMKGQSIESRAGKLEGIRAEKSTEFTLQSEACLLPNEQPFEQRNASICLSNQFVLKLFRRLEPGAQPDLHVVHFLKERTKFKNITQTVGALRYLSSDDGEFTAGVLYAFVESRHDFWRLTLHELSLFLERATAPRRNFNPQTDPAPEVTRNGLRRARLLATRTAEMHLALGSVADLPEFAPESTDSFFLRGEWHAMTAMAHRLLRTLTDRLSKLPRECHEPIHALIRRQNEIDAALNPLLSLSEPGSRIRVHGDFHLGQILDTGNDLVIIDFEGDNSQPLPQRLIKRPSCVDVAGMQYSFRNAATTAADRLIRSNDGSMAERENAIRWARAWCRNLEGAFVEEYWRTMDGSPLVPATRTAFESMLSVYLVAKAIYQVGYELDYRPSNVPIAVETLLSILEEAWQQAVPTNAATE